MLIGLPYFHHPNQEITRTLIKELDVIFPETIQITSPCKDFLRQLLQKDKEKRPTLNEILTHEFLGEVYIEKIRKKEIHADWKPIL